MQVYDELSIGFLWLTGARVCFSYFYVFTLSVGPREPRHKHQSFLSRRDEKERPGNPSPLSSSGVSEAPTQ